jgi:hypothetical protein
MKIYEPCEVKLCLFSEEDVITTSQQNGVTYDHFTDDNWYQGGSKE